MNVRLTDPKVATPEEPEPRVQAGSSPGDGKNGTWARYRSTVAETAAVVFMSLLSVAYAFGWSIDNLRGPLGVGDFYSAYAMSGLWANGSPLGDSTLGFPSGMHLAYYPTGDLTQNALTAFFAMFTDDPFLPLNIVFVVSFPLAAVAALWTIRVAGVRGPLAVVLALGLTTIPFHWWRTEHVYLATMYSAVLAVGIALLVGSGQFDRALRARRYPALIGAAAAVLVIGASGIYYACFAILLLGFALVYRAFRGDRWRALLRGLVPPAAITIVLGLVLLPGMLWAQDHPVLVDVAERSANESVRYSGALAFLLLPAPVSNLPGIEPLTRFVAETYSQVDHGASALVWGSNSGSVLTTALIVFTFVGALVVARRRRAGTAPAARDTTVSLGLVMTLLVAALLFFVPWGLNYLFALVVTPQLRGWERMVPVILTLVVVAGAVVWRDLVPRPSRRSQWLLALVCALVVVLDSVVPYRAMYRPFVDAGRESLNAGRLYAAELNEAVPGQCGVLNLPYIAFPEVPAVNNLSAYGHFLPALSNPDKMWSFGAMKNTEDSVWLEQIGSEVDASEVKSLTEAGFCAVHVDWRGYTDEERATLAPQVQALLGAPVATGLGGLWEAYRLPVTEPVG